MRLFRAGNDVLLFSWTVIDREIRSQVEAGCVEYSPPPTASVRLWEPDAFTLEKTTVWDFPVRGGWAVHTGDYRGNWPPQLVRNLILRYTKPGDMILDTFFGGGTTLIEAWLLDRRSLGIDVSRLAYQTTAARLLEMEAFAEDDDRVQLRDAYKPILVRGDSTLVVDNPSYAQVTLGSVNLLCIHPPYLDALTYTNGHRRDLSQIRDPDDFLERIAKFAEGMTSYLSSSNICALLMGDVKRRSRTYPLSTRTMEAFLAVGYELKDVIAKTQHRDRSSEFYSSSLDGYMLAHEYLYILNWPTRQEN